MVAPGASPGGDGAPVGWMIRVDVSSSTTGSAPSYSWRLRATPLSLHDLLLWLWVFDVAQRSRGAGSARRPGGIP